MYFWIIIAAATLLVDQLSKLLVEVYFALTDHFTFIPGVIDLLYVKNTGAAFSIFENYTWLLGVISILFSGAIVAYMLKIKPRDKLTVVTAGLLLGGALGNGVDRILRGYVVDFIGFAFFDFPVFNIADIAITFGALILIFGMFVSDSKNKRKEVK